MSTRASAKRWLAVWSSPDPADPGTRLEVGTFLSTADGSTRVYLSKYRGEEVASRSIGMGLSAAETVAEALRKAVAQARATRP